MKRKAPPEDAGDGAKSHVAVIGCGWWAQGWHLPHLSRNEGVAIAAVVDASPRPASTLASSPLLSLADLAEKYDCKCFRSVAELLADPIGPRLDGVVVATSHASHFDVGMRLLDEGIRRRQTAEEGAHRALSILMEKPMTTDVGEARRLWETSVEKYPEGAFVINHTASYRPQTQVARQIISSNQIGKIRHISASMNGPLMWLFDDPKNHSWVSKTPWKTGATPSKEEGNATDEKADMDGNGYAWGQIAHILAWIYQVIGADDVAVPKEAFCAMTHAPNTGADVALAAVITCRDGVVLSLTGTALLPGSQYADPPVGKLLRVEIYGDRGCLMYGGDDRVPSSGRLELRRAAPGRAEDGRAEFPCSGERSGVLGDAAVGAEDGFYFEDGEVDGKGPGSMRAFLDACAATSSSYSEGKASSGSMVDDSLIGLRTVQIIHAMYRSSISGKPEKVDEDKAVC